MLGVQDVVVCGHSHCGAMRALVDGEDLSALPGVDAWLRPARPALAEVLDEAEDDPSLSGVAQRNVVNQLAALRSHPVVRRRLAEGSCGCTGGTTRWTRAGCTSWTPTTGSGCTPHERGACAGTRSCPPQELAGSRRRGEVRRRGGGPRGEVGSRA
ncbi:hypothetical protein GCM10020256_02020 [Streptomyces thermocoprophilus]